MKNVYFLDQRKQDKMRWLQHPYQSNVDNLNNVRRKANRHFRNKKKEYLKAKINELESDSNIENSDFKKDYQPRTNIVKVAKSD
jgi:hypothetical protein